MTTASGVREPATKPAPTTAYTSDEAVREALARYLTAVAEQLRGIGHRVSGPTLAPPGERLAGTLTAPAANGDANPGVVVASWNEETGWSTRRDRPHQPTSTRRYLHQRLLPAPTLAAQFIAAATHRGGGAPAAVGLAVADHPMQFRYRTGRAEQLLTQLTHAG